jgi:uncharacterized lipoprotein YmbA
MMSRIALLAALAAACALGVLAGCASPRSHLYTLSASAAPAAPSDPRTTALVVVVGPVSIPAVVDAPQIVVTTSANQVSLEEFNRWASPLQSNIAHVVADDLVAMLGTPRVSLFQTSQNVDADYRVAIEVQTFQSTPGVAATLSALWTVRRVKDGKSETGRTTVREPSTQQGYDALAAAHSRALGRLSQEIADAIRTLNRAGA